MVFLVIWQFGDFFCAYHIRAKQKKTKKQKLKWTYNIYQPLLQTKMLLTFCQKRGKKHVLKKKKTSNTGFLISCFKPRNPLKTQTPKPAFYTGLLVHFPARDPPALAQALSGGFLGEKRRVSVPRHPKECFLVGFK